MRPAEQAGRRSRPQSTVPDRSSMKYCLSLRSNSEVFLIIFICWSGKVCHNFGKLYKGNKSSLVNVECWYWISKWFCSCNSFSPTFRIELTTQVSLKASAAKNWINSFPTNRCDDLCLFFCLYPSSLVYVPSHILRWDHISCTQGTVMPSWAFATTVATTRQYFQTKTLVLFTLPLHIL